MAWLKSGIERLLKATGGEDKKEFWSAYDDCLWKITTSGKSELEEFVTLVWQEPYSNLPLPLLVTMCRLFVSESVEHTPEVRAAINFISAHCSPGEEEGATGGFVHLPDASSSF